MVDPDILEATDTQHELDVIKHHVNFDPSPSSPGQEWLSYPELPTSRDLNPDWDDPQQLAEIRRLLPNTWQEPWQSKNTYLETHYRLQREEAITMLRYSIGKFKEDPAMKDDQETCVYTRVFVRGYLMTRLGPMCQVQFSTERSGKKIRWAQTHRLTVGSLVAISTARDRFKTICMPAIISDHRIRDGLDQNPPIIHFQWANLDDAIMDPNQELIMIETRHGYFEAVRHSMVGLQHVADTETPLDKYLVHADKSDLAAKYVQEEPEMDIRSLVHHVPNSSSMTVAEVDEEKAEVNESLRSYSVLDGFDSRLSRYTNLDNSQLSAVHRILTKELAIVQGPPGTGKTFTSVQALQILLESQKKRGSDVIIVAAQTNHAVDQILIQLIKLGFQVVRLGGRTQNEDIKRYSMYNLRRRTVSSWNQRADRDYKTFESARKKNITMLERVIDEVFPNDLIDPETLRSAGIISTSQLESLQTDQDWIAPPKCTTQPAGSLAEWLGNQMVQAKPQDEKDPDFDATEDDDSLDLDEEDYDIELDDCIVDEDEDGGRIDGRFLPIRHLWTGANPQNYTEDDLVIGRELRKSNLWKIEPKHRGAVYQYWQKKLLSSHRRSLCHILADNVRIAKNLKVNRWYKDTKCIKSQQIEIIGCTTTGLCKYRGLLAALRPRTMLIEEAAETREANILSALYGSLQQLILVGDHQQLAPHCDTPGLADEPYNMRVSMFERLVNLEMPFTVLNMQRRMIPELRRLLNPFYPSLQDHPVVTKSDSRPPVPGMEVPSFFFHHTWTDGLDENMSRYNILEAEMIVHFINYLLQNGVVASRITVLTFYRGQKKKILAQVKNKMKQWAPFTNVFTVDSYQGEENDIVILSLVRSNGLKGPHKAGFLQDDNRGVVSISRARHGFYIFGNMINLQYAIDAPYNMWGQVRDVFEEQGRFGSDSRLPISCQNHHRTTWMTHPEDWVNCHGGCDQKCPDKLGCGHACRLRCHWATHDKLICREPCERTLLCGHRCQQDCGENCLCSCADFTGAYPNDEFLNDATTFKGDDSSLDYDQYRVGPFTARDQRRIGTMAGSRGNRKDPGRGSRLHRGNRPGLGYNSETTRTPGHHLGGSSFMHSGNGQSYAWATFDARLDDEQKSKNAQSQVTGLSDPMPNKATLEIQDTFRPVTVNDDGLRGTRQSITAKTTPPNEDEDLLSFDDEVDTVALSTRSLAIGHDLMGADGLVDTVPDPRDVNAGRPPTEHDQCALGISGFSQSDSTIPPAPSSYARLDNPTSHQPPQPRPKVPVPGRLPEIRQVNNPEWEQMSIADTIPVMRRGDNAGAVDGVKSVEGNNEGQEDLMSF